MIHIANPIIGEEEKEAVIDVLESGMLAQGEEVASFEKEFADFLDVKYSTAVASGTTALDASLKCLGIGEGDEVITTPFSFIASSNSILFQDAKPVFADIKKDTFNLDPEKVKEKITDKTEAILPVHIFGQSADMEAIIDIAEDHDLQVVEDCAQAHGASIKGKKVGNFGDLGTFSFYATKNMCCGEGGMIVSNDKELIDRAEKIKNHGQSGKYDHEILGYNFLMTNIEAAIGRNQLNKLEEWNGKRRKNAHKLTENIRDIKGLIPPVEEKDKRHVYHQYVIKIEDEYPLNRDELSEKLNEKGIGTAIHYPKPIFKQFLYRNKGYKCEDCKNAIDVSEKVLSLPVHPSVSEDDITFICEKLEEIGDSK